MQSPQQRHNQSKCNRSVTRSSQATAGIARPLCDQSKFGFGADGCVHRPREVFQAMMRGRLSRREIYAVGLHKMKCWKCKETFAALLQEFEENMVQEVVESDPQLAEMIDEADEDPDFGGRMHALRVGRMIWSLTFGTNAFGETPRASKARDVSSSLEATLLRAA